MSTPKVTIVVPCYNQGIYINEALDSVENQTFQDYEIIIVNDGSTNEFTNELLKSLKRPKTRVIFTENRGLPAARNLAISEAQGEYIVPLDADDKLHPEYLEKTVKILETKPEVGFVSMWIQCFEETNEIIVSKKIDLSVVLTQNTTTGCALFRKKCWEDVGGYDESMIGYQDWDLWISMRKKGYLDYVIDEPLFYYRIRKGSMLTNSNKNRLSIVSYLYKKHDDILKKYYLETVTKLENDLIYLRSLHLQDLSDIKTKDEEISQLEEKLNLIKQNNESLQENINVFEKDLNIKNEKVEKLNKQVGELKLILKNKIEDIEYLYCKSQELERNNEYLKQFEHLQHFKPLRLRNTLKYDKLSLKKILKVGYITTAIITPEILRSKLRSKLIKAKQIYKSHPNPIKTIPRHYLHKTKLKSINQEIWPEDKPLVSVIIPCFNYGIFVEEAIDSVLNQTFQNLEIIVVEGGSTDKITKEILQKLNKPKTKILFRDKSYLVGNNRNFGIEHSSGKYICCLDADDKLHPTYLEKALFFLEKENLDIVSASLKKFGKSDEVYYLTSKPNIDEIVNANNFTTIAVFKKELWRKANGYYDYGKGKDYIYEDWDLWVRMMALGARPFNILEPLMLYRIHGDSLSTNSENPSYVEHQKAIKEFNKKHLTKMNNILSKLKNSIKYNVKNTFINFKNSYKKTDSQKRILFALPFTILGGMDKRVLQLSKYLSDNGIKPAIMTTVHFDDVLDGSTSASYEEITNEVYHLPRFLNDDESKKAFIFNYLETRNVECIVLIGSEFFYHLLPEIKEKFPKLRVIDMQFNTVGHFANNRKYAEFIDKTYAENDEVKSKLIDQSGESPDKVVMILSGIDTEIYSKDSKNLPEKSNLIPEDKKIILYLGRISEEKGPDVFVDIANQLKNEKDIHFILAGIGPKMDYCKELIEKYKLENITLPGMINSLEYLPYSDILVLPSRLDGRPYTVLEALSVGVPIVASNVGGLPQLIKNEETGILCESENIEEFGNAILKLLNDKKLYKKISEKSRQFVIENSNIDLENKKYLDLFFGKSI